MVIGLLEAWLFFLSYRLSLLAFIVIGKRHRRYRQRPFHTLCQGSTGAEGLERCMTYILYWEKGKVKLNLKNLKNNQPMHVWVKLCSTVHMNAKC